MKGSTMWGFFTSLFMRIVGAIADAFVYAVGEWAAARFALMFA